MVPTIDDDTKAELEIDEIDTSPFSMFAVFDGHGGPACAEVWFQEFATSWRVYKGVVNVSWVLSDGSGSMWLSFVFNSLYFSTQWCDRLGLGV